MAASVPAGARIVALNDLIIPLPITEAEIGIEQNWRTGPSSRPLTDDAYAASTFTPTAEGLRPFSVFHVEQPWRHGRMPGDSTIRWTRRDRALAAASFDATEAPMSEEREAYEVDILDGATAKRTLTATGPNATYTGAQQTADWGALLGPGDTLTVRIAQLSALLGRGRASTVTLTF